MMTQTNYNDGPQERFIAAADAIDEALDVWAQSGCSYCHGDCASANPPVSACIMRMTHEIRTEYRAAREAITRGTPPATSA